MAHMLHFTLCQMDLSCPLLSPTLPALPSACSHNSLRTCSCSPACRHFFLNLNPFKLLTWPHPSLHNGRTSWKNSLPTSPFSQITSCLVYWNFSNSKSPRTLLPILVFSSRPSFYMSSLQNVTLWGTPCCWNSCPSELPPSRFLSYLSNCPYSPSHFQRHVGVIDFCLGSTSLLPHHGWSLLVFIS